MPLDTSAKAEAVQLAIQRRLTSVERLRIALDMSQTARDLAIARLRTLFPTRTDAELRLELLRQLLPPSELPPALKFSQPSGCAGDTTSVTGAVP